MCKFSLAEDVRQRRGGLWVARCHLPQVLLDPKTVVPRQCLPHIARVKSVIFLVTVGYLSVGVLGCNKKSENTESETAQQLHAVASQNSGPAPAPPTTNPATAMPPNHPSLPPGGAAAAPSEGSTGAGVAWNEPSGWQKLDKASAMRKATYVLPPAPGDSEAGEMAVFYFGPQQGGGVEANIKRWIGQFSGVDEAKVQRSQRSVNGLTQHVVEIPSGSYTPGMGQPGSKEAYAMLAAVVETPSGPYFFKATGPSKTIAAARAEYFKMLDSMKVSGN